MGPCECRDPSRGGGLRCTGRLVTKKEGNYKFFLASDDGPWARECLARVRERLEHGVV